jgi:alpha-galactosidase
MPDIYGRNELLLDLTKPEVRDYIVEQVSAVLDSTPISYVKWDMNRHSIALGAKAHEYILGLYDVLGRIFVPRSQILLETCASGGNRFDLGMLCFGPQIWCSDNTDPIDRLDIQTNLSYLYPQSTFGAHVSAAPHAQTLRNTPLTTRGNVAFFGCLGYELDLKHLLPVEKKEIQNQIAYYKEHRNLLQFGSFSAEESSDGLFWQVSKGNQHIAGVFHKLVHAAPEYQRLKAKNLREDCKFRIISRKQKLRVGEFGGLVKHVAPVNLDPNGFILRTADHHYALPDGTVELTASAGALSAGIMLNSRFCGTGYDPNMRQQGDFSSNVFLITPID